MVTVPDPNDATEIPSTRENEVLDFVLGGPAVPRVRVVAAPPLGAGGVARAAPAGRRGGAAPPPRRGRGEAGRVPVPPPGPLHQARGGAGPAGSARTGQSEGHT